MNLTSKKNSFLLVVAPILALGCHFDFDELEATETAIAKASQQVPEQIPEIHIVPSEENPAPSPNNASIVYISIGTPRSSTKSSVSSAWSDE